MLEVMLIITLVILDLLMVGLAVIAVVGALDQRKKAAVAQAKREAQLDEVRRMADIFFGKPASAPAKDADREVARDDAGHFAS